MDVQGAGDMPLVSNRVNEKKDLQNLNQRFAAYIQAIRSAQEREAQHQNIVRESKREVHLSDNLRLQYEQQIAELHAKLEEITREKQENDLNTTRYDTTISEYESRIVSLNQSVFEKQSELQRLHGALAAKDLELQEARADATQPRLALDGARLENDDLRKRLEESDRRLQLEIGNKADAQKQLSDLQGKLQHEIAVYQQEISDMRYKLENSHQLILQLEDKARKAAQSDSSLAEMMKKVREASEAELRRFMDETEAKYNLNIQEVKMRMDADVQNLTALAEENARLQSQIDAQLTDMRTLESKLSIIENQKKGLESTLETEKSMFQSNVRNLERKLQETQDLLLVKIQELGAAQEANIPLRAEINALKSLMEEEEKRLNLDTLSASSPFVSVLANHQQLTASPAFMENLGMESKKTHGNSSQRHSLLQPQSNLESFQTHSFQSVDSSKNRRPMSVPIQSGSRFSSTTSVNNGFLHTPSEAAATNMNLKTASSTSDSISSQIFDLKEGDGSGRYGHSIGMDELPPRPENPTPDRLPPRPSSAANAKYIPATGSQGKDYFDAMFNDLRKDTLYSKVTEESSGHADARVSSVDQDYINSTSSSMASKSGDHVRPWYSGSTTSATGNLKVLIIADDGSSVTVANSSTTQDENLGGFMLQQNVGGHPVAVFRFPPRASLRAASSTTVWSGKAANGVHNPPYHYIWSKLDKWGTGPECTTILCKPNGQAVAWMTSAPRIVKRSKGFKYAPDVKQQTEETQKLLEDIRLKNQTIEQESDAEDRISEDSWKPDPINVPSSYTSKPTIYTDKGYNPTPPPTINRPKSTPLSSRTAVSSGLLPARTGSAPLHLHQPRPPAMHQVSELPYHPPWSLQYEDYEEIKTPDVSSAPQKNSISISYYNSRGDLQSAPPGITGLYNFDDMPRESPGQSARLHLPGTFWPPAEQHKKGMEWLRSQHNANFLPPMPKAFPCVKPVYRHMNQTC